MVLTPDSSDHYSLADRRAGEVVYQATISQLSDAKYREILRPIRAAITRMVAAQHVDDVFEGVLAEMYRLIQRCDPPVPIVISWAKRRSRLRCYDWHRHRDRPGQMVPLDPWDLDQRAARPPSPTSLAESMPQLRSALRALSSVDNEILTLRYECDLCFREIAALLHKPQATIRQRHVRALRRVRARVALAG